MARHSLLLAAVAAVALTPALASAQNACEQRKHDNRVAGTLLGAGIGAVLGSQVAGHGARTEGSVIGAVGGGVIGNQLSKSHKDCSGYGYYDSGGAWHANVSGYYDRDGHWIAANSGGFYDSDGVWHSRGGGYMDADGYWVAQNTDYRGAPAAGRYGHDTAYTSPPYGIHERETWLDQQISRGLQDGSLTRGEARSASRDLNDIRRREAYLRRPDGTLRGQDRTYLQSRLDDLSSRIRDMRGNDRRADY